MKKLLLLVFFLVTPTVFCSGETVLKKSSLLDPAGLAVANNAQFEIAAPKVYVCKKGHHCDGSLNVWDGKRSWNFCAQCFLEFLEKNVPIVKAEVKK